MQIESLTQLVIDYVRDRIVTGVFPPGSKLNESEIASSLGISRHPLREALKVLESEFLVFSVPRKGSYVKDLSADDVAELTQSRGMVECYAIDYLKSKKIKKFPLVEKALKAECDIPYPSKEKMDEILAYHKVFNDFHLALVKSTENYRIAHFYNAISKNLIRYQLIYLFIPGFAMQSVNDHQKIFDLMKSGEYIKARKLLLSHINKTNNILEERIFNEKAKKPLGSKS